MVKTIFIGPQQRSFEPIGNHPAAARMAREAGIMSTRIAIREAVVTETVTPIADMVLPIMVELAEPVSASDSEIS